MNRQAHPWMPVSPCGDGCLPPAGAVPAAGHARQLLRLLAAAVMLLAGGLLAVALPLLRPGGRERAMRVWSGALLGALRIQLTVTGGDRFAPVVAESWW